MRRHEASYSSRMKDYSNTQVKESKGVPTSEELEEEPTEEPVVEYVPQSSGKSESDTDDSEETEEDPEEGGEDDLEEECEDDLEEELEEDQEEDPEEDPEEESSVDPVEESAEERSDSVSLDEDASEEVMSDLSSQIGIDRDDHQSGSNENHSKENKRSLGASSDSDLLQVNQKKIRQEEAFKAESSIGSAVTDLYRKSVVSEAISNCKNVEQQEHPGSSGKRRRSRWDQQLEQDVKTGEGNETSKRKKTRWASDVSDLKMLGPVQLPDFIKDFVESALDPEIQKLKFRLSELNSKLLSSELCGDRPKEKLVKERRRIISKLIKKNPAFETPPCRPPKLTKKLYVPVKEYPTYNFVGILIGPRGNTQKKLEMETGARIRLRGKGSVKEPEKADKSDNEDLHVLIEADNQKTMDAAVKMVEKLLIPIDEGMNEHKRAQLQELAKLNGTHKNWNICRVCNREGHKGYACPHRQSTFKMDITCATCGSFCHPSSSCPLISSLNTKGIPNKETSDADLFVGCLPQAVDETRLKELFCPFGKINDVKVIIDRSTGLSKGYGFVKFESSIDAAMAMTHMNGLKIEGKMLAVRVAGQGRPPMGGLPVSSHLPMYPGPLAAIPASVTSRIALPGLPAYMLPEAQSSFLKNEGFRVPSSSISVGPSNLIPESKALDILSPVVSNLTGSQLASSFDSFYSYPSRIPFASPSLMSQFPGSQLLPYTATPTLKPSPPTYHLSQAPGTT